MEDAWKRILAMGNSELDAKRLRAVKDAMEAGTVGRSPASVNKRFSKAEALRMWDVVKQMNRAETLRKMVADMPANYLLVSNVEQLEQLKAEMLREKEIAVDTETTGVDVYTDVIVGMSFTLPTTSVVPCAEIGKHVYIPVDHVDIEQLSREYVLEELREVLYSESIGKILHNAIFDIAMFRRHGYDLRNVIWDTMTAMHLLNENEDSFRLKDLATKYLKEPSDTFSELFGKDAQFREVPIDIALVYAAKDTDLTWRLYQFQRKHFAKIPTVLEYYERVEVPLLYEIVELEANGYILDLDFAKEYGEKLRNRSDELRAELMATLTPFHDGAEPLNLNSTPQMKIALSRAIGKELPNMDAKKTLKPFAGQFEVIAKLLEYRQITKLSGTYIDALPLKQNPTTGRWHSRFNPMGTVTGRFSSGKDEDNANSNQFNVQNQPKEAREMFIAPEGKVLIGADFKAQEIRCVAYMSGEPVLISAFENEQDPYATLASNYYKKPYEQVNKKADGSDTAERKAMKTGWLSMLYGTSSYSLAGQLGTTKELAAEFMEQLFNSMPVLRDWIAANEKFAAKNGFVWMDLKQRKRRLPDASKTRKNIPYGKYFDPKYEKDRLHNSSISRAMRQATNARVQGSSSVQTKVTMIEAGRYCRSREGWRMWGSVHDELIFEIPEDFTRDDIEQIRRLMTESYRWGDVSNGTDIEVMTVWGRSVSVDEWFKNKEAA